MFKSFAIIRFISGVFLLVFILGITPKKYVHEIFAKHVDHKSKNTSDRPFQLNNSGYNCDCDSLVAESTFENREAVFIFPAAISFLSYISKEISFYSLSKTFHSLRGPPANI